MGDLDNSALILVDIQNDFCPGGALAVEEGDEIVPIVNRLIDHIPLVLSTQDWHPQHHISFKEQGGPWPPHCVQGSRGAELHSDLKTATIADYFRKATTPQKDAYSEFEGTNRAGESLDQVLRKRRVKRIYVAGLATDYCVLETVLDGLRYGYEVYPVVDAMRAVNVHAGDGDKAINKMSESGAHLTTSEEILRLKSDSVGAV